MLTFATSSYFINSVDFFSFRAFLGHWRNLPGFKPQMPNVDSEGSLAKSLGLQWYDVQHFADVSCKLHVQRIAASRGASAQLHPLLSSIILQIYVYIKLAQSCSQCIWNQESSFESLWGCYTSPIFTTSPKDICFHSFSSKNNPIIHTGTMWH